MATLKQLRERYQLTGTREERWEGKERERGYIEKEVCKSGVLKYIIERRKNMSGELKREAQRMMGRKESVVDRREEQEGK